MTLAQETEMDSSEVDAFLGGHETGVLSLAREGDPYSVPISYGYDTDSRTFYLRLVSTPESDKRQFLGSSPEARLVVYDSDDDGTVYRSVVASGQLEVIDPSDLSVVQIEQYGEARAPLFEIWGNGKDDLEIELYEFNPREVSGRRTVVERDDE